MAGRMSNTGNIFKKPHPAFRESSTLVLDGVPPHPPRVPAQLGYRVRRASGTHRGIAPVSPHDTRPTRTHVRAGGINENRFIISFGGCARLRRRALFLRRTASSHAGHAGSSHAQIGRAHV